MKMRPCPCTSPESTEVSGQMMLVAHAIVGCVALAGIEAPVRLRVEYMENPAGVDVPYPARFSWALTHTERGQVQSAYQLVVSKAGAKVWDSKKVMSNTSQNVPYGGGNFTADTSYTWAITTWDGAGAQSPISTGKFSTGLYTTADWSGAKWIGSPSGSMGQFRKSFQAKGPVTRATAYIVGLGYYKLFVNGQKISTHELGAFTTYDQRVYYDTQDCTEAVNAQVITGSKAQAIGVHLGDGWYAQATVHVGKPELLLRLSLEYMDGTSEDIVSDTTWSTNPGPVVSVDIYSGEIYNASMETPGWTTAEFKDTAGWANVVTASPPSDHVKLTSHAILPPIRIVEDYAPINFWQSDPNEFVFDFGQNMAGFVTLVLPEGVDRVAGTQITMLHAEGIKGPAENHSKVNHHYRAKETNVYITRGDGSAVSYTALFTYAGFRYMQLTGYPGTPTFKTLTAHFIHTDYEFTGDISFSDPDLDAVQHITRTAAMSNFQS